jgi:flagellar biosynthetic protein FliP
MHRPLLKTLARSGLLLGLVLLPATAAAQAVNIDLGTGGGLTERVVQLSGPADGAVAGARPS